MTESKNAPEKDSKPVEPHAEPRDKGKPKRSESSFEEDLFVTKTIYPDAEAVFTSRVKSLDSLRDDCVVVLDTNVLLVPFGVSKQSLEQLRRTYKSLADQGRLIVPGHTAREFAKNRTNKLTELYQFLSRRKGVVPILPRNYPLLEGSKDYQQVLEVEAKINALAKEYNDAIEKALANIAAWRWNDPVSELYAEVFAKGVIHDTNIRSEDLIKDWDRRVLHRIPPGYKDGSKDQNAGGDLIIWHTILDIGQTRQKSVLFVSGETKPDWWHRSEGRALYPRYELVDEFRRHSNGQSFHMVELSQLMDMFGATPQVVEEIRKEETVLSKPVSEIGSEQVSHLHHGGFAGTSTRKGFEAEIAVGRWLATHSSGQVNPLNDDFGADYHIKDATGDRLVIVKYIGEMLNNVRNRVADAVFYATQVRVERPNDRVTIVFAAGNEAVARRALSHVLKSVSEASAPWLSVVVGILAEDGSFREV